MKKLRQLIQSLIVFTALSIIGGLSLINSSNWIHATICILGALGNGFLAYSFGKSILEWIQILHDNSESLEAYSTQLSDEYQTVSQFKHDYKHMMASLSHLADKQDNNELKDYLNRFDQYSKTQLQTPAFDHYKDIKNIHVHYLRSLLIKAINQSQGTHTIITIHCPDEITEIPMEEFDFLRIIGNWLSNANQVELDHQKIEIKIDQLDDLFTLSITNQIPKNQTINLQQIRKSRFTTKPNHKGYGLPLVDSISKHHKNALIDYSTSNNSFTAQLTLTKR
ncbi:MULTISPECIES: GHKL domain-containing protein [Holzapfeliella]